MHTNFKTSNEIELRRRMMWWKVFFFVILTKLNFPKSSYEEEEYENQLKDFLLRNKLNLVLVTDPWYPHVCIVWVMFLESALVDDRGNHFPGDKINAPGVKSCQTTFWEWGPWKCVVEFGENSSISFSLIMPTFSKWP